MITPDGANAPAPWVPYTRAGCDFGAVATANTVLENTGTGPNGDITKVFGNPSPQCDRGRCVRGRARRTRAARAKAQTDFVGFAIHCAAGLRDLRDRPDRRAAGRARRLHRVQGPVRRPGDRPAADRPAAGDAGDRPRRQARSSIRSASPASRASTGCSPRPRSPTRAEMQEAGVPVTYAYISDAHDFHGVAGNVHTAFGPGSAGYVAQLKAYDDAFARVLQPARGRRHQQVATRCSCSPSTRATTSSAASRRTRAATA